MTVWYQRWGGGGGFAVEESVIVGILLLPGIITSLCIDPRNTAARHVMHSLSYALLLFCAVPLLNQRIHIIDYHRLFILSQTFHTSIMNLTGR